MRLFRRPAPPPAPVAPPPAAVPAPRTGRFEGLTDDWRIAAEVDIEGRLADLLNQREPLAIRDVYWAPVDGSGPLEPAPGIKTVDPYDLIVAMAGEGCTPVLTDAEREAYRVHRMAYEVVMDVSPFTVAGTVHMPPGTDPSRLLDRNKDLFFAVTDATIYHGNRRLEMHDVDVVLVNRSNLHTVDPVGTRNLPRA